MFIGKFFHLRAQFDLYMYIKHTIYLPIFHLMKGLLKVYLIHAMVKLNGLQPQGKQISLFIG